MRPRLRHLSESSLSEKTHREVATFCHPSILGRDRGLLDPFLQALNGFIVMFFDLCQDR